MHTNNVFELMSIDVVNRVNPLESVPDDSSHAGTWSSPHANNAGSFFTTLILAFFICPQQSIIRHLLNNVWHHYSRIWETEIEE